MNAVTPISSVPDQDELIGVLQASLYPGAKRETILLVLAWCRANDLDPMLKPVHIVPTSVKAGTDKYGKDLWEKRDLLMPGIASYRIKATRSGEYVGMTEPEFGPIIEANVGNRKVSYPEWCRVTVFRHVKGKERGFPAKEYWLENYASAGRNDLTPNTMWAKRPYGQLSKCAESQSLRKAFPEFSGGYTAEEMEGKTGFDGTTIEGTPDRETTASTTSPVAAQRKPSAAPAQPATIEHEQRQPDPLQSQETREKVAVDVKPVPVAEQPKTPTPPPREAHGDQLTQTTASMPPTPSPLGRYTDVGDGSGCSLENYLQRELALLAEPDDVAVLRDSNVIASFMRAKVPAEAKDYVAALLSARWTELVDAATATSLNKPAGGDIPGWDEDPDYLT